MTDHALEGVLAERVNVSSGRHGGLLAGGAAWIGLQLVALAVLAHRAPYFPIDLTITHRVQSLHAAWIDLLLRPFNLLGFPPLVGIVYGSVVLLIFAAGARWEAVSAGFATLGAAGLNYLVKILVDRPRPPIELVHVVHQLPSSGFPAGHVLNFTAFAGFLCYVACVRLTSSWQRAALITFVVALTVLMGTARIYSGEHWASDVLGGYLIGILWLVASIEFYRWGKRTRLWSRQR